uniref:Peroxisomal membrane protein PEX14 n=1 Tax=Megafenestra aurita TaxID=2291010 RepID=A0A4Y7NHM6_9CRUS|nr:EOG090X0FQ8 [Megafenestra aurita]SVE92711.1 EOG090X0FQ8 [Megafenestra aurita]
MNEMNEDNSAYPSGENIQPLREELVSTAVKFLQNPRVSTRPRSEKELFLEKKGLNKAEILAAFKASGIPDVTDGAVGHYSSVKVAQLREYSHSVAPVSRSKWAIIKDILNASFLIAGAAYSLHYLYRKLIEPYLFGPKKKKSLVDTVEKMNSNLTSLVNDVSVAVQTLSCTVATLQIKQYEQSEIKELKAEMASLKALMLGRRQFPAPPSIVTGPPSIPPWQMGTSNAAEQNLDSDESSLGALLLGLYGHSNLVTLKKNIRPTIKLATQLTVTAMAVAIGRAEELKSSVTRNQGIEPGPQLNPIYKTSKKGETIVIKTFMPPIPKVAYCDVSAVSPAEMKISVE